jgi:hypothetical protein
LSKHHHDYGGFSDVSAGTHGGPPAELAAEPNQPHVATFEW